MFALLFLVFSIMAGGCSHVDRKGVISQELPLTVDDLAEIRSGEENHRKVLEDYRIYSSPKVETYLNAIAASIAEVSTRPNLPYRVFILDEDSVNIFGGAAGHIYMTRGLLDFVQSEAELAGVIAHEIGHISHRDYSAPPNHAKIKLLYAGLLKGSETARDAVGTYGTAVHYGIKGIGKAAPHIARRFNKDTEIEADERAVEYLLKANYDPREFLNFVERLARIKMNNVGRFVMLLNTHPPFQDRREMLAKQVHDIPFEEGKIEFKKDMWKEVLQITVVNDPDSSIVFEPKLGVHHVDPFELNQLERDRQEKFGSLRKRGEWF